MKNRLESELISIAHRILKLKNKSEVNQLYKETQKLYETLTVLKFYQDNFESVKSELTEDVLEEKLEQSMLLQEINEPIVEVKTVDEESIEAVSVAEIEQEQSDAEEEEPIAEEEIISDEDDETKEADEEQVIEEITPSFSPIFELEIQEEEVPETAQTISELEDKTIALEDFLGDNYTDPVFVKPNEVSLFPPDTLAENPENTEDTKSTFDNETYSKSIAIGLNDRIGFVQHLFNDSNEDFNRVISQLNTFDTFEEAERFINEMVIPDYDYWVGEEDYMERFLKIVEKKFQ